HIVPTVFSSGLKSPYAGAVQSSFTRYLVGVVERLVLKEQQAFFPADCRLAWKLAQRRRIGAKHRTFRNLVSPCATLDDVRVGTRRRRSCRAVIRIVRPNIEMNVHVLRGKGISHHVESRLLR